MIFTLCGPSLMQLNMREIVEAPNLTLKSEYPDLGVNLHELLCLLGLTVGLQTGRLMWRARRGQRKGQTTLVNKWQF